MTEFPKWQRRGIWAAWLAGGTAFGLLALSLPFVLPALRRHCLPYVPATPIQIEKILHQLKGRHGKMVDLGSGDGRVVIAAAKEGHYAVGYELNVWLVLYSRLKALVSGVHGRTEFHKKDLWKVDLSPYENIVIFGVESMMEPLGLKISSDLSTSCNDGDSSKEGHYRIIACRFQFPQQTPTVSYRLGQNSVWVYDSFK